MAAGARRPELRTPNPPDRRMVPKLLGTGALVGAPPKLTTIELVLIYNYNFNSCQSLKLSIKILNV
jgi:hypothetical protein